jgi:hypothetical protein
MNIPNSDRTLLELLSHCFDYALSIMPTKEDVLGESSNELTLFAPIHTPQPCPELNDSVVFIERHELC